MLHRKGIHIYKKWFLLYINICCAWCFQIFLMATHLFFFIHDVLYAHIRQHKKMLCSTKNCFVNKKIFRIEVSVATKIIWVTKKCCGNKEIMWHPKEDSCWLNMFSVAQKRNTYLQKMVPVVYKYMLCMVLSDFLNGYTSVFLYSRCSLCSY